MQGKPKSKNKIQERESLGFWPSLPLGFELIGGFEVEDER